MIFDTKRATHALHSIPPELPRDEWVKVAMAAHATGISFKDFDEWSSQAENYNHKDTHALWFSLTTEGGIGAGTLFYKAAQYGWQGVAAVTAPTCFHRSPLPAQKKKCRSPPPAMLWNSCVPATIQHPYIIAKRGEALGLKTVPTNEEVIVAGQLISGWLAVPVSSLEGELRTIQFIPPPGVGKKLNLAGASFGDVFFVVGDLEKSSQLFIVEGIGQAWACTAATGFASVVAFGWGRVAAVAKLLRTSCQHKRLIIVPDRGKEQQAEAIARDIRGEWVALPEFVPSNFDANDFAADYGDEKLADLLAKPSKSIMRYKVLEADAVMSVPPLRRQSFRND